MTNDLIKEHLRSVLEKGMLLDLEDGVTAGAVKAHELICDYVKSLNKKRAREAEGQLRFRLMEQAFEDTCKLHGGYLLEGSVIPNTELQVFQPFMRFKVDGKGVILGLASMSEPRVLPVKNKSRLAGVTINYNLIPRLDFDGREAKVGDIFSLLLVSRNREMPGKIEEVAVGVVDSKYEFFLFYERLDKFLREKEAAPVDPSPLPMPPLIPLPAPVVSLKPRTKPYIPPESPASDDESIDKKET